MTMGEPLNELLRSGTATKINGGSINMVWLWKNLLSKSWELFLLLCTVSLLILYSNTVWPSLYRYNVQYNVHCARCCPFFRTTILISWITHTHMYHHCITLGGSVGGAIYLGLAGYPPSQWSSSILHSTLTQFHQRRGHMRTLFFLTRVNQKLHNVYLICSLLL